MTQFENFLIKKQTKNCKLTFNFLPIFDQKNPQIYYGCIRVKKTFFINNTSSGETVEHFKDEDCKIAEKKFGEQWEVSKIRVFLKEALKNNDYDKPSTNLKEKS